MRLRVAPGHRSVIVSTLGITQTLAWGSTYYLPAVALLLSGGLTGSAFLALLFLPSPHEGPVPIRRHLQ